MGFEIVFLLYLLELSIEDLRKKQIRMVSLAIGCLFVLTSLWCVGNVSFAERVVGSFLGIMFLLVSKLTRGAIGIADGILILYLGVVFGISVGIQVLCISFMLCCLFCMCKVVICHVSRKKRIPFVPFLFMGTVGILFLN